MMYFYTPEQHAQILDALDCGDYDVQQVAREMLKAMQPVSPVGEVVTNVGPRLYKLEDRSNWGMLFYTPTKD